MSLEAETLTSVPRILLWIVPCDRGSPETPAQQGEVVRHGYEDEGLCALHDLVDGVHISGSIFGAEDFGRRLQRGKFMSKRI